MKRMSMSAGAVICAVVGLMGPLSTTACSSYSEQTETQSETGELRVPLTTQADGKTYRLSNLSIRVAGSADLWLYGSDDPAETALVASLPVGSYTSDLETFSLERADRNGTFRPVVAELVSDPHHEFSLLNSTTTTISYRFETDGQIVHVGAGSLRVEVAVEGTAGVCTPLGGDCEEGTWCAPPELTGQPLACIPAGSLAPGERCQSHLDCAANTSCFDFGDGMPICGALCGSGTFGEACETGGTCQPHGSDYGVCTPDGSTASVCPLTRKFWPTIGVQDAVFDAARCRLYASTEGGSIVAHDLAADRTDTLAELGSSLRGLDLSPDGSRLVTADPHTVLVDGQQSTRLHLLNLDDGELGQLSFPLGYYEYGTHQPLFVDESTLLVSSTGWSLVPLRRVDLSTGTAMALFETRPDSMLAMSADRSRVAFAESSGYNGEFGSLSLDTGGFTKAWSYDGPHTIAVSRDGASLALPVSGGVAIYDSTLSRRATLSTPGGYSAAGVVYSPDSDVLYVAWRGLQTVEAIHSVTLESLFTIDQGLNLGYGASFGPGRLRISQDGKLLIVLVEGGVMTYPVQFN